MTKAHIILFSFLMQLAREARIAEILISDIVDYMPPNSPPRKVWSLNDKTRFWINIERLIMSGANVSKLLWPPANFATNDLRERAKRRGEYLRSVLLIREEGYGAIKLLKNRDVRNALEHLDERMDEWADRVLSGPSGMISLPMATSGEEETNDGKPAFALAYDPDTYIFRFWDHDINLRDIASEVIMIGERAYNEANRVVISPNYNGMSGSPWE